MSNAHVLARAAIDDPTAASHAGRSALPSGRLPDPIGRFGFEFRRDSQFVQMLRGYRASGGLARQAEVLQRLQARCLGARDALERWMDEGLVCSLVWRGQVWLPLFQFSAADRWPKPAVQRLLAELAPAYEGWEACRWFAEPNSALQGQRPADLIDTHAGDLHHAARADRYAVLG